MLDKAVRPSKAKDREQWGGGEEEMHLTQNYLKMINTDEMTATLGDEFSSAVRALLFQSSLTL